MRPFILFRDDVEHNDLEKFQLSGPVKREMQTLYKAHLQAGNLIQGKIEIDYSGQEKNYIVTYDEEGFVLRKDEFGTDGHNIELFENKLHTETIKYKPDGSLNETVKIIYDDKGRLLTYTTRKADGKVGYRSVNVLDTNGKTLENITYKDDTDTQISGRTVYNYDTNGNTTSIIKYNEDKSIRHQSHTTYNGDGKKIESVSEWFEKTMIPHSQRDTYRYNSHGDCIEMVQYKMDGTIKDTFTFNYEYDSEGKKIIRERRNDFFDLKPGETEKLELDRYGNWIKKTIFYKNIPVNTYVRDIVYYDDAVDRELVHVLASPVKEDEVEENSFQMPEMEEADAKWLAEAPNISADNFPAMRYYTIMHREVPSVINYTGPYIEALTLLEELKENLYAKLVHSYGTVWNGWKQKLVRYTLDFPGYPYLLQATGITARDADEFDVPDNIDQSYDDQNVYTSQFQLFYPSEASGKRDWFFEHELTLYIDKCSIDKKPDKPVINMIEVSGNSFVMREHPVDDDFEIDDLDINYGYGFEEFHEELMVRFNTSTKGLVLFHGEPGTGKTYYIRHLLRSMVANKKVVIYMPPNMVDHLIEPGFMTFLTEEVKNWSEDGNFCVLLIEDAEPLLAKRQEGIRIQGITNLLNMSDGLLNDMLNLQIICTFNVGLRKLDSALLRPGRLIARKEFKALSELDANLLAQRIGIKHHFKGPATLGEIYAMRKNQNILVHDVDSGENSSTHIDDLI